MEAGQTPYREDKMAVGARIVLRPARIAQLPGSAAPAATAAIEAGTGRGRKQQPREGEFRFLMIVGGQGEIVIFDTRVFAERKVHFGHGGERQKRAGQSPEDFTSNH